MDYVVGSVAALISGNVTPNRPKIFKRALTPMKHQPSPNVTPKSESATDRSIFLSPTMQKKKAIVKKSPKRIFQNPDLDFTSENDGSLVSSPKADKVKKHLEDELSTNVDIITTILSPKSPKNAKNKSVVSPSKKQLNITADNSVFEEIQMNNESTPKKKKKKHSLVSESITDNKFDKNVNQDNNPIVEAETSVEKSTPKKKRKSNAFTVETVDNTKVHTTGITHESTEITEVIKVVKKLKRKKSANVKKDIDSNLEIDENMSVNKENEDQVKAKKSKKGKKKDSKNVETNLDKQSTIDESIETTDTANEYNTEYINPNAITTKDTDSEHESDDDIESENEESNKAVLDTGPQESSDDEDEIENKPAKKSNNENVVKHQVDAEEIKRTLFVGNVPFSSKCKKEIKRIFSKYGEIETVRIRTVPVKDARVTPKLAVIKNELHPDRSTVNVYIKYVHPSSVNDALVENNTVLNDHHLRVARSDVTGSAHDPRHSVFVGNIPFALEDEGLRAKFDKCGEIESVRIVRDRKTNVGKGFGYVNFKSKDGVELALALTEEDLTIKNRILRVKRCTQATTKQLGRQQSNLGRQQNYQGRQQNYQGRQQNYQGRQQNYQGRQQNYQGRQQNHQGQQNYQRRQQMDRPGRNQFGNDRFQGKYQNVDNSGEGAYRRIMNKRKPEESTEGPPQKRQKNLNQPNKEKKPRKDFVGITADRKKIQKRKLTKDQKKKKALSEILTKQRQ